MSQAYIHQELTKVLNEQGFEYPKNLAMATAWLLGNLKGINLKILDTQKTSSLADFFVLGSASNSTQLQSMAESIINELKAFDFKILSVEGMAGADWVLLDLGDVIVHIFLDSSRPVYDLDNLWSDALPVTIPTEYYFSADGDEVQTTSSGDKDYF